MEWWAAEAIDWTTGVRLPVPSLPPFQTPQDQIHFRAGMSQMWAVLFTYNLGEQEGSNAS